LQDDSGNATHIENPFGEGVIINLSVWESVEALRDFIYRTHHLEYMRWRREWFDHEGLPAYLVLWHVPDGHIPTIGEAADRLEHLVKHGATEYASPSATDRESSVRVSPLEPGLRLVILPGRQRVRGVTGDQE
jgi:hypothetical protein